MARLPRPYIPIAVRVQVAERQFDAATSFAHENGERNASVFRTFVDREHWKRTTSLGEQLDTFLRLLFGDAKVELHHRPALVNRARKRNGDYDPPANDPAHLIYLVDVDHDIETRVRGQHGAHSDLGQARKNKRIANNRNPRRRKVKIPQRKNPWPKRSFPKRTKQ